MIRRPRFRGAAGRVAAGLIVVTALSAGLAAIGPRNLVSTFQPAANSLPADSPVQIQIRSPHGAPVLANDAPAPMFMELNMRPGGAATNCVSVTNKGPQHADIRFFSASQDKGLAPFVSFTVDAGAGGHFHDCAGFRGTTVYRGTLAELTSGHHDFATGIRAPAAVFVADSVTFRFTETLSGNPPQGAAADASFMWEARAAEPTPSGSVGRGDPLASGELSNGRRAQSVSGTGRHSSIPHLALRILIEIAKRGWIWVLLLIAVVLFLLIQDRIDRREPKLAQARVHPDADIAFERPERPAGGTP